MDDLFGQPFGLAYEIVYDNLQTSGSNQDDSMQKRPGKIAPIVDKTLEEIGWYINRKHFDYSENIV